MECRSCGSTELSPVIDLGLMPLANDLSGGEARFPLEVVLCRSCALAQLTFSVPPDVLFSEYPYFSSQSRTMIESARTLVYHMMERKPKVVLEAGSNDGYLLQHYVGPECVLGIEPAANVAREASVPTLCAFFTEALARTLPQCDVFHANNVLAHVADPNDFVEGIATVLAPDGVAVIEVPYVRDLIERCEFDTIYHEHLCYFSLSALHALFDRHGLGIIEVEHIPLHGGSLRLFVQHGRTEAPSEAPIDYDNFARRVDVLCGQIYFLMHELHAEGKTVAGYGASAKGAILLNSCGIRRAMLECIVDSTPYKQGKLSPGLHVPIVAPPLNGQDYALLLSWNFADEIMQKSERSLESGSYRYQNRGFYHEHRRT